MQRLAFVHFEGQVLTYTLDFGYMCCKTKSKTRTFAYNFKGLSHM